MTYINFYRGLKSKYDLTTHANGVYFATDTAEILMNDVAYTGALSDSELVKLVAVSEDGSKLIITYTDNTTSEITIGGLQVEDLTLRVDALETTVSEHTTQINSLSESIEGLAIKSVSADEKVLTADANGVLTTTMALGYDSVNSKIQLTGIEGVVVSELDASEFIKDGMIDSVVYNSDTRIITITWNTAAGKDSTEINISHLVDVYTAAEDGGLSVSENVFAIKLDAASSDALSLSTSGLKFAVTDSLKEDLGLTLMNTSISDHESRISAVENILIWQEIQ